MARVKRGVTAGRRHKKILGLAKDLLVAPTCGDAAFDSCHDLDSSVGYGLFRMRKKLLEAPDIGLVDHVGTPQLPLRLLRLVTEVMATVGRAAFEALRCFAKALRRSPVGFQLGHDIDSSMWPCSQAPLAWRRLQANR